MTSIYVVRHTQAEGNLYRMMQGHWDGNVTQDGKKQIDKLAERFKDVHIDAVYSSDLRRAVATAEGITRYNGLSITTDERLREIDMGPLETEFFGNLYHLDPENAKLFMYDSDNWYYPGAETFARVKERVYEGLEDIAKRNDGKVIAVVSHGVAIRCLLSKIKNVPLSDIRNCPICKNTSVAFFTYDEGNFNCEYFNDVSHLGDEHEYHWWKTEDLRDEVIDVAENEKYYKDCYKDAWLFAHCGDLSGYNENSYFSLAKKHTVYKLLSDDTEAGLVELSDRGVKDGYGWICLLYLNEKYRGKGYGTQALGRAVSYFSKKGIRTLRLHCAASNNAAFKFYINCGFKIIATESGAQGPLYLMERKQ